MTRDLPRRWSYPLAGFALAQGAPCGHLLLRLVLADGSASIEWVAAELAAQPATYAYLEVSTAIVFVLLGIIVGARQDHLSASSLQDPMTGLANRRHLHARLLEELERSARHGSPLALLLIDVDGLKGINDGRGHRAGDVAIKAVAEAIRATCRQLDLAARWGGDEFVVLAPGTRAEEAAVLAQRIRSALGSREAGENPVTVSIGVTDVARCDAPTPEAFLASADRALYAAKRTGRDRIALAGPDCP